MLKYSYKAITSAGVNKSGTFFAENNTALVNALKSQGLSVYSYRIISKQKVKKAKKLNTADLIAFSTQLSQMLVAGLSLGTSLQMLYEKTENKKKNLKMVFAKLFESVQKGQSLSESMEEMEDVFPALYLSMVKSGQLSGKLDETLVQLADHYDKQKKQQNLIKGAMSYPIILAVVCVLVVGVLTTTVLPKMVETLPEGTAVPLPTKILIGVKDFILQKWHITLISIVFIVFMSKFLKKVPKVQEVKGKFLVNAPKIGRLNKMRYTASFASSLSTLYAVGVNLLDAIQMAGEVTTNLHIRKEVMRASIDIRKGKAISESFSTISSFDPMLTTMMYVGEQSGSLGDILKKTSDYFDEEATTAVKGLTAMLQPAMLLIMSIVVGFVLIGVMMPMFAMYKG